MEGKSVIIGILGFGGLSFYLVRHIIGLLKPDSGYKQVPVTVEFYSGKLILRYNNIDRQDRMGQRREEYTFFYSDLEGLDFSVPLQCLNIRGGPMLRVHFMINQRTLKGIIEQTKGIFRIYCIFRLKTRMNSLKTYNNTVELTLGNYIKIELYFA